MNALSLDALIASNQSIALWGWGREGQAAYRALRAKSSMPLALFCSDVEAASVHALNDPALSMETAPSAERLSAFKSVIKSPGISAYRPEIIQARARGTQLIGGTALWFASRPDARTICVTGSKGKSTTTALLAHLLRAAGVRTALAGNIGLPLLELIDAKADYWAIELSSYQTRDVAVSGVRPDVAIVTNLFPEHLDWHGDEARYIADKLALLTEAKPRIAILNAQDPRLTALHLPDSQIHLFGQESGWHVRGEWLYHDDTAILDTTPLPLPGTHNRLNLCAVLTALDALDVPLVRPGEARRAFKHDTRQYLANVVLSSHLTTFTPLPHRLQPLGTRDGITWVNDSISTTPHATLAALEVYQSQPIALLLGGFDRGLDWTHFANTIQSYPPRSITLIGQTASRLQALLSPLSGNGLFHLHVARNLQDATTHARSTLGQHGGIVLLSPGAPSFDAHRDYIERGQRFAALAGFAQAASGLMTGMGVR